MSLLRDLEITTGKLGDATQLVYYLLKGGCTDSVSKPAANPDTFEKSHSGSGFEEWLSNSTKPVSLRR